MPDELALFSDSVDDRNTKFESKEPFRRHETKKRYPGKEVKIRIIPEECIFSQEESPEAITKSIRLNSSGNDPSLDSSILSQASFSLESDIPTQWSSDLREGLTMMGIDYHIFSDFQLPSIFSLFNALSYPTVDKTSS